MKYLESAYHSMITEEHGIQRKLSFIMKDLNASPETSQRAGELLTRSMRRVAQLEEDMQMLGELE